MTTFTAFLAKTPKVWTDATVIRIAPPADLDRNDVFVPHPGVPRLFIRFRRATDGSFGTGTYTAIYARAGKDYRQPLGKVGAVAIEAAVQAARELFAAAGDVTRDPRLERQEAKAAHSDVFSSFVPAYLKHLRGEGCKLAHVARVETYLTRCFPDLAELSVAMIKRVHCARAIERLLEAGPAWRGGRGTTAKARLTLRAYFEWLIRRGVVESNPVAGTEAYAGQPRKRVLEPAELQLVWNALGNGRVDRLFKLIILTGARRDQIAQLRRSWVHLDGPIPLIRFPGDDAADYATALGGSKNGEVFELPLSRQAVAILRAQLAEGDHEYVFGAPGAAGGFSGWSKAWGPLLAKSGTADWTLHDLRRTFVSISHEQLGASRDLLDACINHKVGSAVSRIYNRAQLLAQRLPVAQAWADYCDSLTGYPKLRLVASA